MSQEAISETLVIQACHLNNRLDALLRDFYKTTSRTYFQKLIDEGLILVNGKSVKKSYKPVLDDEVEVQFVATNDIPNLQPENIPLDILYEDPDLLAINKPQGMCVHPGFGNWTHTFVNALLYHYEGLEKSSDDLRPGIVHRLDKETSGVLLAAKTYKMQKAITCLFSERKIKKSYLAICLGKPPTCTINAPIGRHPVYRKEMTVLEKGGKEAVTHIEVIASNKNLSIIKVLLETGRTHQIRVHMKHIGHPILGDSVYGREGQNQLYKAERQMLHAEELTFIHPFSGKEMTIKAPLPQDMLKIYEKIL